MFTVTISSRRYYGEVIYPLLMGYSNTTPLGGGAFIYTEFLRELCPVASRTVAQSFPSGATFFRWVII